MSCILIGVSLGFEAGEWSYMQAMRFPLKTAGTGGSVDHSLVLDHPT